MSERRYEAFEIINIDGTHLQGKTVDGKVREFSIEIVRDLVTNELDLVPYRHFIDGDSISWFPGSEPWTEEERHERHRSQRDG